MASVVRRLWWALPDPVMSSAERFWHDVRFWLSGIPYGLRKTWQRATHLAEDAAILLLGFLIAFIAAGSDEGTRDRATQSLIWAGLALGAWLSVVFLWNLAMSYPRRHWNLLQALERTEGEVASLRYQRDFYKDAGRRKLRSAARLLKTELRDIQEKVELIDATVAGHTYWEGFAFPAGEWQRCRQLVADDPSLYAAVERAYTKANRANEIIHQRRTRAGPGKVIGRAAEEDLPGVTAAAGDAVRALDELLGAEPLDDGS